MPEIQLVKEQVSSTEILETLIRIGNSKLIPIFPNDKRKIERSLQILQGRFYIKDVKEVYLPTNYQHFYSAYLTTFGEALFKKIRDFSDPLFNPDYLIEKTAYAQTPPSCAPTQLTPQEKYKKFLQQGAKLLTA